MSISFLPNKGMLLECTELLFDTSHCYSCLVNDGECVRRAVCGRHVSAAGAEAPVWEDTC